MRSHGTSVVAVLSLCLLAVPAAKVAGQDAAEIIGPTQQIPRDGFKTWSLFLVCTPDWVAPERSGDLANLYRRFKRFGDAIGRDNLAVWFWKTRTSLNDPRLSENVDVSRSADYCRALTLRPSLGPFLVVTTAYPELNSFPQDRAVFTLGGLPAADLVKLLNTLTDQLLLEGRVEADRASANGPAVSGFWIQLLEGARRAMIGLGCNLKMQVSTGVLTAELRGCETP